MCGSLKSNTPYGYNNGSSLGGTTWSTGGSGGDDDSTPDSAPEPSLDRDDDEREM